MLPFLSIVIPSGYSFALGSSDRTVVSATVVGAAPTGVAKVAASTKRQAIVVRIGPPCRLALANSSRRLAPRRKPLRRRSGASRKCKGRPLADHRLPPSGERTIGTRQVAAELRRRKGDAHVQARAPSRDDVAQARRARNGARDAGSVVRPYDSAPEKRRIEVTVA